MFETLTSPDALPVIGGGLLSPRAVPDEQDTMIASIGPFWDANETWLVLGIGLLLVAFPIAHGIILSALYLPVALMLAGLILRGVAFDFRAKVHAQDKKTWDLAFLGGSLLAAMSQGYMLGMYIVGFTPTLIHIGFSLLCGICLASGYAFIGACWLIMKTEHDLQVKAAYWARFCLWLTALGLAAVSLATPLVSPRVFSNWFTLPTILYLSPIPIVTGLLIVGLEFLLRKIPMPGDRLNWLPFIGAAGVFLLGFVGLAYSFYPYVVPDRLTIWQAASAPESLLLILFGAAIVLPCILAYTFYSYRVFWGKVSELKYY